MGPPTPLRKRARTLFFLVLLATSCSGDDSASDASPNDARPVDTNRDVIRAFDAGPPPFDAGFDGGRDAGPDSGPWTSEWRHEPRIEVHDVAPCEPWEPVADPLLRGLPADPTPRVLWDYYPETDPLYDPANSGFKSVVQAPVVSPDGTIWVRGPGYDLVTQLNRNGTMRGWFRAGGAEPEDEWDRQRLGPLAVAPNGSLIAIIAPDFESGESYVARVDPDEPLERNPRATTNLPWVDNFSARIAIAPDGMVYVASRNRVYATCRAERLMWTLTNELAPGEEDVFGSGSFSSVQVEDSGSLLLSGGMQRVYRIADGILATSIPGRETVDAERPRYELLHSSNAVLFGLGLDAAERYLYLVEQPGVSRQVMSESSRFQLSPASVLWLSGPADNVVAREPPYTSVSASVSGSDAPDVDSVWFSDDSYVAGEFDGEQYYLRRVRLVGNEVVENWRVAPTPTGDRSVILGPEHRVLDDQGVYYRVVSVGGQWVSLVAIQTDGLPPPNTMCVDLGGCNPHRDRYIRPSE